MSWWIFALFVLTVCLAAAAGYYVGCLSTMMKIRAKQPKPNEIIGVVEHLHMDHHGIYVEGQLNELGKKILHPGSFFSVSDQSWTMANPEYSIGKWVKPKWWELKKRWLYRNAKINFNSKYGK